MLKILKKIKFKEQDDRMSNVGAVEKVIENFEKDQNKNFRTYR